MTTNTLRFESKSKQPKTNKNGVPLVEIAFLCRNCVPLYKLHSGGHGDMTEKGTLSIYPPIVDWMEADLNVSLSRI